jgi:hypothetical protein
MKLRTPLLSGLKIVSVPSIAALCVFGWAQSGDVWTARYDGPGTNSVDTARAVAADLEGNAIVAGKSWSTSASAIHTVKYDSTGSLLWARSYVGPGGLGGDVRHLAVAADGSIFVAGHVVGTSTSTSDDFDLLVLKYSPSGQLLWAFRYGGLQSGAQCGAERIVVDGSGNVYAVGTSTSPGGQTDLVTIKIDPQGTLAWAVGYNGPANGPDSGKGIGLDAAGNVIVGGTSFGGFPWLGGTGDDFIALKYSPIGTQVWQRRIANPEDDSLVACQVDAEGNVFLVGDSATSSSQRDILSIRLNSSGTVLWTRRFNGHQGGDDLAADARLDALGRLVVTGVATVRDGSSVGSTIVTFAYDTLGTQVWTGAGSNPPAGIAEYAGLVRTNRSGHVYVAGHVPTDPNQNVTIAYQRGWRRTLGLLFRPTAMAIDPYDNVLVAGYGHNTATNSVDFALVRFQEQRIVTGNIQFGGLAGPVPGTLQVQLRPVGSTEPFAVRTIAVDSVGNFSCPAPSDLFDLSLKGGSWLRRTVTVDTRNGNVSGVSVALLNGDVNDDNRVNLTDFSLLSAAFRSRPGDSHWNPNADLNRDGTVNLADFSILSANFRLMGDP